MPSGLMHWIVNCVRIIYTIGFQYRKDKEVRTQPLDGLFSNTLLINFFRAFLVDSSKHQYKFLAILVG